MDFCQVFDTYIQQLKNYKICIPPWENISSLKQKHCHTQVCHKIQPQLLITSLVRNKNPLDFSVVAGSFVSKTGICKHNKNQIFGSGYFIP